MASGRIISGGREVIDAGRGRVSAECAKWDSKVLATGCDSGLM